MSEHGISSEYPSTLPKSQLRIRNIQLLQLRPGKPHKSLKGTTLKVSLDDPDCPKFEALSYISGTSDTAELFLCNGEEVEISANLARALRRIRWGIIPPHADPMRPFEVVCGDQLSMPKFIWVDALCVDRRGEAEVKQKDLLVREIYSEAERVIIWIHDNDVSKEVLATGLTALDIVSERVKGPDAQTLTFVELEARVEKENRIQTELNVWEALDTMFSSQWFDRADCIGEFGLAQEVALLNDNAYLDVATVLGFLRWYEDRLRYERDHPASPRMLRNLEQLDKRLPKQSTSGLSTS
jgi:hypothetical protein